MEDVLEQLRECNEHVPVPLELPDEDLLVEIEEQLLINIPRDFREYLLLASDVIYGRLEPVTVTDPQSHTYLPEVAAIAWDQGMPRDLLPVCEIPGGYYCIAEDGEILLWREGRLDEGRQWDSIWFWIRDIWLASGNI